MRLSFLITLGAFSLQAYGKPYVMGALGDSVSTATNSTGWGDKLRSSWSTGTSFGDSLGESHFQKLQKIYGKSEVKAYNKAVSGSESSDLGNQIQGLSPYNPDYVTILMGGNDLCHMPISHLRAKNIAVVDQLEENMAKGITTLVKQNQNIKILLVPIPDLIQVRELGQAKGCQWIWDLFQVCKPILPSQRTPGERANFAAILKEANQRLVQLAGRFPENVRIDPSIGDMDFEPDHISSRDCFHPSGAGQAFLAEKTWSQGWFP
jgi:lysophospholipase L1-like esterase